MSSWQAAAVARPLPLRMRADLTARLLRFHGRRYWGVKDPVALRYYQLRDEEYAVLQMLDGSTSARAIKDRFDQLFAPRRLSVEQLQTFLMSLHEQGLVVADAPGQGDELLKRRRKQAHKSALGALSNMLSLRFRGVDPAPFLDWLYPKCRWLFSGGALTAAVLLVVAAVLHFVIRWETVEARLPRFEAFFSGDELLWFAVALGAAKVLHELGHALTCRHFGGECHEMGIMFLVFTPCLYCDVSDAWMMPSKWHRIAISSAGVAVEIVLAAACFFLWWFTEPGLLNALCLKLMFVCSVSSIVFNGNPLLRYDGYYVFSDLVEVPNLGQRSTAVLRHFFARWFLDVDEPHVDAIPSERRPLLATYGIASTVYRGMVAILILWFAHRVLRPYGLDTLAHLLGAMILVSLIAAPAWHAAQFVRHSARTQNVSWRRFIVRTGAVVLLAAIVLAVPWGYPVTAPVLIEPQDASSVYVSVPGTLLESVRVGDRVEAGQRLALLENLEVRREVEQLRGERDRQKVLITNLERRRVTDPQADWQLPAAREALADLDERLQQRERDQQRLVLSAPIGGAVLPAPVPNRTSAAQKELSGQLPFWTGYPTDERNQGTFLPTGTVFCRIGAPDRLEAVLVVDQANVEFVEPGQTVRLRLDQLPSRILRGKVSEVGELDLKLAPRELVARNDFSVAEDATGQWRPLRTSYQVRVALDDHGQGLIIGATGEAKIGIAPEPLYRRLHRYASDILRVGL